MMRTRVALQSILSVPIDDIDDSNLVKLFLDLETAIDVTSSLARMDAATVISQRLLGSKVQNCEDLLWPEVERFLNGLVSDSKAKQAWEELRGLALARSLEVGDFALSRRLVSLARTGEGSAPLTTVCNFMLEHRQGTPERRQAPLPSFPDEDANRTPYLARVFRRSTHISDLNPSLAEGATEHDIYSNFVRGLSKSNDPYTLIRWLYKRGEKRDAEIRMHAYLLLVGFGLGKSHVRIQSPKNIRRQGLLQVHLHPQIQLLSELASAVERLEDLSGNYPFLAEVQAVEEKAQSLLGHLEAMSVIMALRTLTMRHQYHWYSNHLQRIYENLSISMTGGVTADGLGILAHELTSGERSGGLLSIGSQVATKWVAMRTKTLFAESDQLARKKSEFIEYCGALLQRNMSSEGGLFQKIMQLGSGVSGAIPIEIRDILANSCFQSKAMPEDALKKIIADDKNGIFSTFNITPFACGSIAQLHTAQIDGSSTVIKIKRHQIEKRIEQEFSAIKRWLRIGESFLPVSNLGAVLEDWRSRLLLECDLLHERKAHEKAYDLLKNTALKVPKIYGQYSNEKYLVQEYVAASSFSEFLDWSNQSQRNQAAKDIMEGYLRLNLAGIYYMDIHQGNFLFQQDKVILIDFGGVMLEEEGAVGPEFLEIVRAIEAKNHALVKEKFEQFGIIKDPSPEEFEILLAMHRDYLLQPFLAKGSFKFTPQHAGDSVQVQLQASRKIKGLSFPKGANQGALRFFWSLFSLLGEMKAEADWRAILEEAAAIQAAVQAGSKNHKNSVA